MKVCGGSCQRSSRVRGGWVCVCVARSIVFILKNNLCRCTKTTRSVVKSGRAVLTAISLASGARAVGSSGRMPKEDSKWLELETEQSISASLGVPNYIYFPDKDQVHENVLYSRAERCPVPNLRIILPSLIYNSAGYTQGKFEQLRLYAQS